MRRNLPLPCRMGATCRGLTLLAVLLLLLSSVSSALAQRAPKALPPLEGNDLSYAYAINNRGEVAGLSRLYDAGLGLETFTAVVWR